jgi:hypothetical protein
MTLVELSSFVVSVLQANRLFNDVRIVQERVFSDEQFALKIRAQLTQGWQLQIYLYYNRGHYDYAYQVFHVTSIMRWDNKEDCPGLANFPHHYHPQNGGLPVPSTLVGDPISDLPIILASLENLVTGVSFSRTGRKVIKGKTQGS